MTYRLGSKWYKSNDTIYLKTKYMLVYWKFPFDINMPHPALLNLVEWLLFSPYGVDIPLLSSGRKYGDRYSLAYSGGIDSSAAIEFIPNPILVYAKHISGKSAVKEDNAVLAVNYYPDSIIVESNANELPLKFNKPMGYWCITAFTIPCVLLADYFNIGFTSTGDTFCGIYRKFIYPGVFVTKKEDAYYSNLKDRYANAGIKIYLPVAGLTSISTYKIYCQTNNPNPYAMSCVRGENGQPCNNCSKCFRTSAISGNPIPSNSNTDFKLSFEYPQSMPELMWCVNHNGLIHSKLTSLANNSDKDVSWVDKWIPDSIKFVPEDVMEHFKNALIKHNIDTQGDITPILNWSSKI